MPNEVAGLRSQRCARLLESDYSYRGSAAHGGIVLVCQANFHTAWRAEDRFDHFARFVFVRSPHTNKCAQFHFK